MSLYLQDYPIGDTVTLGTHTFTAEAITAFARLYDPQPFHLDAAAAKRSHFGGLCASGWHTGAVWMRLNVQHELIELAAMTARGEAVGRVGPSPGFSDMRFLKPVRPGDRVTFTSQFTGIEDWPGKPAWGLLLSLNEGRDQHGELVFSFAGKVLIERRPAQVGTPPL